MRMMTSVLTFALVGVSRYFLNAFTPRVVSRATAVNGTNRRLGTLGNGFGVGSIYCEHRLKQSFGSYPLFSISWIGSYRGGKTPKAVENFQRRAVISSSSKETKPKDTKLVDIRQWLEKMGLDAIIVPSSDPHLSEYPARCFLRREWLTGFTGSVGTAVVTKTNALLWTDGRYFIQALDELGSEWELMTLGQPNVLSMKSYMALHIPDGGKVGLDPFLVSAKFADEFKEELSKKKIELVSLTHENGYTNPIDELWGKERPDMPRAPLRVHPERYAGKSPSKKLADMRKFLMKEQADALVLCALDEIAYLFNLRGSDVECNPVALAFAIITRDRATLYVDSCKITAEVSLHLSDASVQVAPYNSILPDLRNLAKERLRVWLDPARTPLAFFEAVPDADLRVTAASPVALSKAVKNRAELDGMRNAHVRDGAAIAEFMNKLETEVEKGKTFTEYEIDSLLTQQRSSKFGFLDRSFNTIAGADGNGAVIHYRAKLDTCATVGSGTMLLLDSGRFQYAINLSCNCGQYIDGTTDVTRTIHLGTPSSCQRTAFTNVLKGHIALDTSIFPEGTRGYQLDSFARRPLWEAGMDYAHGTGHGVGAALNVHEGPQSISPSDNSKTPLQAGMILSNEPGFYVEGKFGVRIENLLVVKYADHVISELPGKRRFLKFDRITYVPIQKKLIDVNLMSSVELDWLDEYHEEVYERLHDHVDASNGAREWLLEVHTHCLAERMQHPPTSLSMANSNPMDNFPPLNEC